jgi:hypothetical protein
MARRQPHRDHHDGLPAVDPTGRVVEDDPGPPPTGLVRQVLGGTEGVEDLLARAAVAAHAKGAAEHAARVRSAGGDPLTEATRTVAQHVRMARAQGATTGAAITALETTSLWGSAGTLTVPAAATGLAMDLTTLAWVQARMVLHVAALSGRDPHDGPARMRELLTLWGIEDVADVVQGGRTAWAGQALRRVASPAARLRALLRMVGLRSLAKRVVPLLNVPLTAAANARTTAALGADALELYANAP